MFRRQKKLRGTRGYKRRRGAKKRCRNAGNRGGRGRAGCGKRAAHNKLRYLSNPGLGLPGKHGFTSIEQREGKKPTILNVDQLDKLAVKLGKTELNLTEMGYNKLLGSGKVTQKLTVNVSTFSESAKTKIEAAGGKITGALSEDEKED
ncbi:MAG: uL15 family ribosomal protein [Candidatus Nanoarchaeia archaeon]|nr:uL15 family ribosomal protein [Candidatus Nanoarchaeia archaeon]MDD5239649.1 uL15 family ribosomal protein [Candidatus Nanoarchaeia archaeon]